MLRLCLREAFHQVSVRPVTDEGFPYQKTGFDDQLWFAVEIVFKVDNGDIDIHTEKAEPHSLSPQKYLKITFFFV